MENGTYVHIFALRMKLFQKKRLKKTIFSALCYSTYCHTLRHCYRHNAAHFLLQLCVFVSLAGPTSSSLQSMMKFFQVSMLAAHNKSAVQRYAGIHPSHFPRYCFLSFNFFSTFFFCFFFFVHVQHCVAWTLSHRIARIPNVQYTLKRQPNPIDISTLIALKCM